MVDDWIKRHEGYREWNKTHDCYKILYAPDGRDEHGNRIDYGDKSVQKKYDKLSRPAVTYPEKLQDELKSTIHPAMGPKRTTPQTLEEEKEEWDFCMDQADHDTMLRREMAKIRREWAPWKEKGVTDTHKVIYEAEKRVKKMSKKDINKYKEGAHEI